MKNQHKYICTCWSAYVVVSSVYHYDIKYAYRICNPYISTTPCQLFYSFLVKEFCKIQKNSKFIKVALHVFYVVNGTRSYEEADGRLRRVLGDGLAAEGGEDRHGYQPQGGRRMSLNRYMYSKYLHFFYY